MSPLPRPAAYHELREHEFRKSRLVMIDGALTVNSRTAESGTSARVYDHGYWGFASVPTLGGGAAARVTAQAAANARRMAAFGPQEDVGLPHAAYVGRHEFAGQPALTPQQVADRLAALNAHCRARYPALKSVQIIASDEHHTKRVSTSVGGDSLASIQRALLRITFLAEDANGAPVELYEVLSCKGSLADLNLNVATLAPVLDRLHEHLQAKRHAVPARGGLHTVVMDAPLAGMLAHEAMGHPCEADIVLGGAVTGGLVGQRVADERITMLDVAHTYDGQEVMVPVYADDEGMPAQDAVLIEGGVLQGFMHSRETAARMGMEATGSARAYGPNDEPLVRMRNTVILPGTDSLADMIAGVEDGYFLMKTSNGQADSTTEFMFGINLAYEIRNGRIGRAVRDTTLSGSALRVLQSVDAVGREMDWSCSGYCGKKQPMVVSMGGPALRARAHLGGQ